MNVTYLAHHGIKGMKWGVRRQYKKAVKQRDRYKNDYNFRKKDKYAEVDDKEFLNLMSPEEKKEVVRINKLKIDRSLKYSIRWEQAVKDISKSQSSKEAKSIYEKYKKIDMSDLGHIY